MKKQHARHTAAAARPAVSDNPSALSTATAQDSIDQVNTPAAVRGRDQLAGAPIAAASSPSSMDQATSTTSKDQGNRDSRPVQDKTLPEATQGVPAADAGQDDPHCWHCGGTGFDSGFTMEEADNPMPCMFCGGTGRSDGADEPAHVADDKPLDDSDYEFSVDECVARGYCIHCWGKGYTRDFEGNRSRCKHCEGTGKRLDLATAGADRRDEAERLTEEEIEIIIIGRAQKNIIDNFPFDYDFIKTIGEQIGLSIGLVSNALNNIIIRYDGEEETKEIVTELFPIVYALRHLRDNAVNPEEWDEDLKTRIKDAEREAWLEVYRERRRRK